MSAWKLAPALETLRKECEARWPNKGLVFWTIGDEAHQKRASDHNPNTKGFVCAIDIVAPDVVLHALWEHLIARQDRRTKYLILKGQIVSATVKPWQVRDYTGSNPHTNHIHVSVGRGSDGQTATGPLILDASTWGLAATAQPAPMPKAKPAPKPAPRSSFDVTVTGHPFLKRGARGLQVTDWQALVSVSVGRQLRADGIFGPATDTATREFQRTVGLKVDGIVGPATLTRRLNH